MNGPWPAIQCKRYTADGKRCTNPTRHHDGWCQRCAGLVRPKQDISTRIMGVAGGSGYGGTRARARIGRMGELRTAHWLDELTAGTSARVFHGLRIPGVEYDTDVDHALLMGRQLILIDSKLWRPGIYFRFGGHIWRFSGHRFARFPQAESRNMEMARDRYRIALGHLVRIDAITVVHSSQDGKRCRFVSKLGHGIPIGEERRFGARLARMARWAGPPDPAIIDHLNKLLRAPARTARV